MGLTQRYARLRPKFHALKIDGTGRNPGRILLRRICALSSAVQFQNASFDCGHVSRYGRSVNCLDYRARATGFFMEAIAALDCSSIQASRRER